MKDFYYKPKLTDKIVILTGTEMSSESGIQENPIEDIATKEAYDANPKIVVDYYKKKFLELENIEPNAAHTAITLLEKKIGNNLTLITQNIDNLHQKSGTKQIFAMHGELTKGRCENCNHIIDNFDYSYEKFNCPFCKIKTKIRPHVVWFRENPLFIDEILNKISNANLFIAIGISGSAYPASHFVNLAVKSGATTLLINTEPPENNSSFEFHLYGKASKLVPDFIQYILMNFEE